MTHELPHGKICALFHKLSLFDDKVTIFFLQFLIYFFFRRFFLCTTTCDIRAATTRATLIPGKRSVNCQACTFFYDEWIHKNVGEYLLLMRAFECAHSKHNRAESGTMECEHKKASEKKTKSDGVLLFIWHNFLLNMLWQKVHHFQLKINDSRCKWVVKCDND